VKNLEKFLSKVRADLGKGLSRGEHDINLAAGIGNKSISLKNCHNVTLRDVSILHGGHFAILATGVDTSPSTT